MNADASVEPLFPRAHKRALGVAVGLTAGVAVFLVTGIHVVLRLQALPIGLLGQYFYGYDVSWPGVMAGIAWGSATGFVAGWLLGFVHNFTLDVWLLLVSAKQEREQARDLLDHI